MDVGEDFLGYRFNLIGCRLGIGGLGRDAERAAGGGFDLPRETLIRESFCIVGPEEGNELFAVLVELREVRGVGDLERCGDTVPERFGEERCGADEQGG